MFDAKHHEEASSRREAGDRARVGEPNAAAPDVQCSNVRDQDREKEGIVQMSDHDGRYRPKQETDEEDAAGGPNWNLVDQHHGAADQRNPGEELQRILAPVPASCAPIMDYQARYLRMDGYTEDEVRNLTYWEADHLLGQRQAEEYVRCNHRDAVPIDARDADAGYAPDPLEGRVQDWQVRWLLRHAAVAGTTNVWQLSATEAQARIDAWPHPKEHPVRPCRVRYSQEAGSVMAQADGRRTLRRGYQALDLRHDGEITTLDRVPDERLAAGEHHLDHVLKVWAPRSSDQADEADGRWQTKHSTDSGTRHDYSPPDRRYYVEVAASQVRAERRAAVESAVAELREQQKHHGSRVCGNILDAVEVRWFVCTGTERADRDAQIAATTAALATDGVQRRPLVAIEYYTTHGAVPGRTLGFLGDVSPRDAERWSRKTPIYLRAVDSGTRHCHTPIWQVAMDLVRGRWFSGWR